MSGASWTTGDVTLDTAEEELLLYSSYESETGSQSSRHIPLPDRVDDEVAAIEAAAAKEAVQDVEAMARAREGKRRFRGKKRRDGDDSDVLVVRKVVLDAPEVDMDAIDEDLKTLVERGGGGGGGGGVVEGEGGESGSGEESKESEGEEGGGAGNGIVKMLTPEQFRQDLIQFGIYILFLTVFMVAVMHKRDPTYSFFLNDSMKDLILFEEFPEEVTHILKTQADVATSEEFWQYMEGPLLAGLLDAEGSNVNSGNVSTGTIYGTNSLIGLVRIQQLRVRADVKCSQSTGAFARVAPVCFAPFSSSDIEKSPFGDPDKPWVYHSESAARLSSTLTDLDSYPGSGHIVDIPIDLDAATAVFADLRENGFIDLQTRFVSIYFSLYNGNINTFQSGQVYFEFLASGGVVPGFEFRTFSLLRYTGQRGITLLVSEIILVVFIVFYLVQEISQIVKDGPLTYLQDGWNFVDILNLLLFVVAAFIRIISIARFNALDVDPTASTVFYNLKQFAVLDSAENNILACNAVLLWCKVFKYSTFFMNTQLLVAVVYGAFVDICVFIVMFGVVLMGFATAGYLAFGTDVPGFYSPFIAIITLFAYTVGDFDLEVLRASNRYFGPLFFMIFMVVVVFIVLSMFLAIVNDAFQEVQSMTEPLRENRKKIMALYKSKLVDFFSKKKAEVINMEEDIDALQAAKGSAAWKRDDAEVQALLKEHRNLIGDESAVWARFDKDGNAELDEDEIELIREELEARKKELTLQERKSLLRKTLTSKFDPRKKNSRSNRRDDRRGKAEGDSGGGSSGGGSDDEALGAGIGSGGEPKGPTPAPASLYSASRPPSSRATPRDGAREEGEGGEGEGGDGVEGMGGEAMGGDGHPLSTVSNDALMWKLDQILDQIDRVEEKVTLSASLQQQHIQLQRQVAQQRKEQLKLIEEDYAVMGGPSQYSVLAASVGVQ